MKNPVVNSPKQLFLQEMQTYKENKKIQKLLRKNMFKNASRAFLKYFNTCESQVQDYIQQNQLDDQFNICFFSLIKKKYDHNKYPTAVNLQQFLRLFYDKETLNYFQLFNQKDKLKISNNKKNNRCNYKQKQLITNNKEIILKNNKEYDNFLHYQQMITKFDKQQQSYIPIKPKQNKINDNKNNNYDCLSNESQETCIIIQQQKLEISLIMQLEFKKDNYIEWLNSQSTQIQKLAQEKKILRVFAYKFFSQDFMIHCLNSKHHTALNFFRLRQDLIQILSLLKI